MFAVIRVAGHQYEVSEGDTLVTSYLSSTTKDKEISIDDVLLLGDDGYLEIGHPRLTRASVKAVVIGHAQGKKIRVQKFKAKVRYRKTLGFKPKQTNILIKKITNDSTVPTKKAPKKDKVK